MVCDLRREWESKNFKTKKEKKEFKTYLAKKYEISQASVEKYLKMTAEEVENLSNITVYKKRDTSVKDYLNMIFKMLKDKIPPQTIYDYILSQGYKGSTSGLENHIRAISINNNLGFIPIYFNVRHPKTNKRKNLITRSDILKYMTIKDKSRMNKTKVAQCYDQILKEYPILKYLDTIWNEFHETLMGNDVGRLVEFINKYEKSEISEINQFIGGIKKDIAPVKNAISFELNSGFVEGENGRLKAIKRNMFGRAGQTHLFYKMYAVSIIKSEEKKVQDLLEKWLNNAPRSIWPKRKRD